MRDVTRESAREWKEGVRNLTEVKAFIESIRLSKVKQLGTKLLEEMLNGKYKSIHAHPGVRALKTLVSNDQRDVAQKALQRYQIHTLPTDAVIAYAELYSALLQVRWTDVTSDWTTNIVAIGDHFKEIEEALSGGDASFLVDARDYKHHVNVYLQYHGLYRALLFTELDKELVPLTSPWIREDVEDGK